jgi:hypothetical protein
MGCLCINRSIEQLAFNRRLRIGCGSLNCEVSRVAEAAFKRDGTLDMQKLKVNSAAVGGGRYYGTYLPHTDASAPI